MLKERQIDFSETKEKEWNLIRSKLVHGIELNLQDSGRWFSATVDGENIKIEGAKLNVRPLAIDPPMFITFESFKKVIDVYPEILKGGVTILTAQLELQKTMPTFKYTFMLIYSLV